MHPVQELLVSTQALFKIFEDGGDTKAQEVPGKKIYYHDSDPDSDSRSSSSTTTTAPSSGGATAPGATELPGARTPNFFNALNMRELNPNAMYLLDAGACACARARVRAHSGVCECVNVCV
jgi:hypothetical protein